MHRVSVIIPTRGRAQLLSRALDPVIVDDGVAEIIVVVDGPDDDTQRVLAAIAAHEPRLRAVTGQGHGAGAARHAGIREATGDVVVLLDDDVIASPGLAAAHGACHGNRRQIVVGRLVHAATSAPDRLYAATYDRWWQEARCDADEALRRLWLGNASLRRVDALAVGLDAPAMRGRRHEDRELGLRLAAAGFSARVAPDLVAEHAHHRTAAQLAADCRAEGAGLRALHGLHGLALPRGLPLPRLTGRLVTPLADRSIIAARVLRRAAISEGARG